MKQPTKLTEKDLNAVKSVEILKDMAHYFTKGIIVNMKYMSKRGDFSLWWYDSLNAKKHKQLFGFAYLSLISLVSDQSDLSTAVRLAYLGKVMPNESITKGNAVHQKLEDQIKNTNIFIAHLEGQSALTISKSYSMTEIQVGEIIQKEAARTAAELSESMLKLDESEIPIFDKPYLVDNFNADVSDIVQKEREEKHRKLIDQYPFTYDEAFPGPDRNKPPLHGSLGKDPYPHRKFNNMIIRNVAELRENTNQLRIDSPYYPHYLRRYHECIIYFSTLVRIHRNHVWYAVHHVRSFEICDDSPIKIMTLEMDALKMFRFEIHKSSVCYKANPDDRDSSQQSEYDRLTVDDK